MQKAVGLVLIALATLYAGAADAHWRRNCPIPTDLSPYWASGPIVGWTYPCHRVRANFAPPRCWRTYVIETAFGLEQRRDYLCR